MADVKDFVWEAANGALYACSSVGVGTPVVLLHGFTGSQANWHESMQALASDYHLLAVDLPGHGRTRVRAAPECYDVTRVAHDLNALVNAYFGPALPPHLVGYSMGGRHALACALASPRQYTSLVLESASPGLKSVEERTVRRSNDDALADAILRNGLEWFVAYWEKLPLFASQQRVPPEKRGWLRDQRLANDLFGLALSLRGAGTGAQPSFWDDLPALNALPVMLLTGAEDVKFNAINDEMASLMPHGRRMIITDAGHASHFEQPAAYSHALRSFFETV
ncbi:MAG: 2-succinyl-6-hydroxy-2,4-cyclohexadiene-1-carboxylate synthase [Pleurocapsa minor GSE-CHR-MK-17-07R]|jgi:2-succinyl-6-hydroxy-2,4-cyclohexadiene-1-carboxylate synthase|nr:2-succinyl-6-hydroxy-2,4-cyclohexadiene-1-carboxylate synthase [Pleurocapsa minor GSE-CHR-MK 17-07R]